MKGLTENSTEKTMSIHKAVTAEGIHPCQHNK